MAGPTSFEWYHLKAPLPARHEHVARPLRSRALRGVLSWRQAARFRQRQLWPTGEVKVWDVATGKERFCLTGHNDFVSCVAFSPDGRRLASANGGVHTPGEIKIWDPADGRELSTLPAHPPPCGASRSARTAACSPRFPWASVRAE